MIARWRAWRRARQLRQRIRALSLEQRAFYLKRSRFEPYWEQGMEGDAYVIARDEPDFGVAMAAGPGLFPSLADAEDWIIAREVEKETPSCEN